MEEIMVPIRNKVIVVSILTFFLCNFWFSSFCKEFELLYTKPVDFPEDQFSVGIGKNYFGFLSRNYKLLLISLETGNIDKVIHLDIRVAPHFVSIDEQTGKVYFGCSKQNQNFAVYVYNLNDLSLLKRFLLEPDTILIGTISSDYKYLLVVDVNYNVRIYNLENDSLVFNLHKDLDENLLIYFAKFSNDCKKIALVGGTKICLFDIDTKTIQKEINSISYHTHKITFSNNDEFLLKYNYGSSVEVFDIATGEKKFVLEHPGRVKIVLPCLGDSILITSALNKTYFWDFKKGTILENLSENAIPLGTLNRANKEFALIINNNESLSLWDIESMKFIRDIYYKLSNTQFVAGGSYFASGLTYTNIFNTITAEKVRSLKNKRLQYYNPYWNLYYYYRNDTIYLGQIFSDYLTQSYFYPPFNAEIEDLRFTDDMEYLFCKDTNQSVYVIDWNEKKFLYKFDSILPFLDNKAVLELYLKFSKNRKYVAGFTSLPEYGKRRFFVANGRSGDIIYQLVIPNDISLAFVFSNDEKYLLMRVGTNPLTKIDIEKGNVIHTFENIELVGRTGSIQICAFPDRPWLAISSRYSAKITIVDYDTYEIIAEFDDNDLGLSFEKYTTLYTLDVSSDGNYLLTEYYGQAIKVRKVPKYSSIEDNSIETSNRKIIITQNYSNSEIQIDVNTNQTEAITFAIYDFLGRKVHFVKEENCSTPMNKRISISHLPNGSYILVVKEGNNFETFKFYVLK